MSWLDLSGVKEDRGGFEMIPVGSYHVCCKVAELKETKDGTGSYISCQFEIMSGDYEGRKIFNSFNIKNKSQKCVEIGLGQLKAYLRLAGKDTNAMSSPTDLEGTQAIAVVKHQAASNGYEAKAVVSYFKPVGEEAKAVDVTDQVPF